MALPDYTDVERMIFRGFLVEAVEVEGVPIIFKTVNETEYDLALLYSVSSDSAKENLLQECYFIASSVYLFNRVSVLDDRETFFHEFVDVLMEYSPEVRLELLRKIQGLNARALKAIKRVEGFSYGQDSRQMWSIVHRMSPNDPRVTGIQGTQCLGLNAHQRLWYHYNLLEDKREEVETDWAHTKFAASVHSKEISKIDSQDKTRRRDEQRRREAIFYGEIPEEGTRGVNGEVKVSHESVDDLLGQLKRDIEGQKDFHDQVVEAHERKVREQWEKAQAAKAERALRARQAKREQFSPDVEDPIIFYDEEAVKRLTQERKQAKRTALLRGDFEAEGKYQEQTERMRKWGIIGTEDPEPTQDQGTHPLSGTIMDDYYDVQMPDMTNRSPFDDE